MRKRTKGLLLAMVLLIGTMGALGPARQSEAADPLVMRGIFVFVKSIKRATADRAAAIGAVNAGRDDNLQAIEQQRAVADYYESKSWITPAQRATVGDQLDELRTGLEDLARRERQIVRHDTKFTRVLGENLRAEARLSAPQILVKLGVPEAAARVAGAAIQGEKPLSAVLDAAITKATGGPLVDPARDPLADLKAQVGALQQATDALRGTSKVKIAAELLGVQEQLERISGLPLPEQGVELGTLRRAVREAEGTLAEAGAVRDRWLPRWMGPGNERFARDGKWQAIHGQLQQTAESRVKGAVAAGIAATNEQRLADALRAAGRESTDEEIANLRAALARATAEAWASGRRPPADELVGQILGTGAAGTPGANATVSASPTVGQTGTPAGTAAPSPTKAPTATPTVPPTPTATPTGTPTPRPTATPTTVPAPTVAATPGPLPNRSLAADFPLGDYAAHLSLALKFSLGTVSGTLSGSRSEVLQGQCGQGSQLIETAQLLATSSFSTGFSGAIAPTGGPFSAPVSIVGTTTYSLTKPFTKPQCVPLNASIVPPAGSFSASGTVSGTAVADNPTSINVNTTLGSYAR